MTHVAQDPRFPVSAEDRSQVIDTVNRLNLAFDVWDIDTMVAVFTEDGVVDHARGEVKGHEELRRFYDAYRPLTLGVRRQAVNHVVDGLPDGTIRVYSYNILVRVAPAADHERVRLQMVSEYDCYPAMYIQAVVEDIFRIDPGFGWRICRRSASQNSVNRSMRA